MEIKIGCVIMASGQGKRFGGNKLLCELEDRPVISYILEATACLEHRIVVTRHREIEALCARRQIPVMLHDQPDRSDTIRLGLTALLSQDPHLAGCMFAAADQPRLQRTSIENLCRSFQAEPQYIWRLSFHGCPGNPVIFPYSCFDALLSLPERAGGSYLMQMHPEMVRQTEACDSRELLDVDTPEALALL